VPPTTTRSATPAPAPSGSARVVATYEHNFTQAPMIGLGSIVLKNDGTCDIKLGDSGTYRIKGAALTFTFDRLPSKPPETRHGAVMGGRLSMDGSLFTKRGAAGFWGLTRIPRLADAWEVVLRGDGTFDMDTYETGTYRIHGTD